MKRSFRVAALAMIVLLLGAGFSALGGPVARAQPAQKAERAKQHFARGEKLFARGKFRAALVQYREAYQLVAAPELLFNIGQCHRNLGNPEAAVRVFRRFLAAKPKAKNRAAVNRLIRELSADIAARRKPSDAKEPVDKKPPIDDPPADSPPPDPEPDKAPPPAAVARKADPGAKESSPALDFRNPQDPGPVDEGGAFYTSWWFWAGTITVGAVVGGTAYYLSTQGGLPDSDLGNVDFPK